MSGAQTSSSGLENLFEDYNTTPVPSHPTVGGLRIGLLYSAQAFAYQVAAKNRRGKIVITVD